ncbi:dephospho-CoA kinase, partial [Marinobacter sp. UBA5687]
AIADHFGERILQGNGELDRAALRQKVFEDPEQRRWLEGLLHPIIRQELIRQLSPEDYNLPYVMLVSPLLLETNQHELVERIVVVDVPEETQINRTMARDGNSREQVERILAAQMPRAARREKADAIINNAQPLERVEASVHALHQRFLADFSQGA